MAFYTVQFRHIYRRKEYVVIYIVTAIWILGHIAEP